MQYFCLLSFILVIFNTHTFCQSLLFKVYQEPSGLPSPIVYCICQDSRGFLWFGTARGLSRFDGSQFQNIKKENGLPGNNVNAILEDRAGNLWIGTDKGCISIPVVGTFPVIKDGYFGHFADWNYPACGNVYSIVEDNEKNVWFGTSKGIFCFRNRTFQHFSTLDSLHTGVIFKIAVGEKGRLWLGTDKGLGFFEKGKVTVYSSSHPLKSNFFQNHITALLYDSNGSLWVGTINGLSRVTEEKVTTYRRRDGLVHNAVTEIMEDIGGNIWVGTWEGVSLFEEINEEKNKKKNKQVSITNFGINNGLPDNFVYSIRQDNESNIWFGTHDGASRLSSINVTSYSKKDGLPHEMIIDIIEDKKGRLWFGTSRGLCCYSKGKLKTYTTNEGLVSNDINALMEDCRGNILIATLEGLSIFSSGSFSNYSISKGKSNNILFCMLERQDGSVWIGSRNGIIRFMNGTFTSPPIHLEQVAVHCIMEDRWNNLWFSSRDRLYKYSRNGLIMFSKEDGLTGDRINVLFENRNGKVLIGTEGGLSCFDGNQFASFAEGCIPADIACNFLVEDKKGNLWFGNSKGVTCFDGKQCQIYNSERLGLTGRSWFSGIVAYNGKLWFGSTEGVTCFFPPPIEPIVTSPPIHITGVKVMENEISPYEMGRFNHEMNIFRFNFIGLSFTSPSSVQYKYRLHNIDKFWQITQNRSLFYPFLPPGSYKLEVKAVNCDGVESVVPACYSFKILPPFWRTWWFICLILIAGTIFLVLGIHWKIKRVREKEEQKNKETQLAERNRQLVMAQRVELMGTLAAGTVHDLKNLMAIIVGYSQVMAQKHKKEKDDLKNIGIIKDTAATVVKMAIQILSFARPKNQDGNEVVDLRWVLTDILDTLKITQLKTVQIHWHPPTKPVRLSIEPVRFQQLVMNLCLNACHAMPDGGELKISLTHLKKEVFLEIKDTGIGIEKELIAKIFDPMFTTKEHGKGTGLGLFVVKQVVEEYNGTIDVHSEPGKGTAFAIRFPTTSRLQ